MEVFTGFLPASMDTLAGLVRSSRVPLFVPGRPIWPTRQGSAMMAQAVHSPLLRRCGPQPWFT